MTTLEINQIAAAWVQAGGALLAIVVAFIIANGQAKAARKELEGARRREAAAFAREDQRAAEQLRSIQTAAHALLNHAVFTAEHCREMLLLCKDGPMLGRVALETAPDLAALDDLLGNFPIQDLGDHYAVEIFAKAKMSVVAMRSYLLQLGSPAAQNRIGNLGQSVRETTANYIEGFKTAAGAMRAIRDAVTVQAPAL